MSSRTAGGDYLRKATRGDYLRKAAGGDYLRKAAKEISEVVNAKLTNCNAPGEVRLFSRKFERSLTDSTAR